MTDPPKGFWFEEHVRGNKEVLIVMFGPLARGSIEVNDYAEKVSWTKALATVNSTLDSLSSK